KPSPFSLSRLAGEGSPKGRVRASFASIPHQSAIDVERLAGDIIGLSRGQEGGHVGDVVRGIRAPQRDRDVHARGGLFFGNPFTFGDLLHDTFVHTGAGRARADSIDVNVIFGELRGADAGHGDHRALGAGVGDVRGAAKPFARNR